MIALFSQIADLARCIAVNFPELAPEVIGGTESAGQAYFLYRQVGIMQQSVRGLQPVTDQHMYRGAIHIFMKTARRLASADARRPRQYLQR